MSECRMVCDICDWSYPTLMPPSADAEAFVRVMPGLSSRSLDRILAGMGEAKAAMLAHISVHNQPDPLQNWGW